MYLSSALITTSHHGHFKMSKNPVILGEAAQERMAEKL